MCSFMTLNPSLQCGQFLAGLVNSSFQNMASDYLWWLCLKDLDKV